MNTLWNAATRLTLHQLFYVALRRYLNVDVRDPETQKTNVRFYTLLLHNTLQTLTIDWLTDETDLVHTRKLNIIRNAATRLTLKIVIFFA